MSHNSFDDAVLARLDEGIPSHPADNLISINSLSRTDFQDFSARRADPVSGYIELGTLKLPGVIDEKPFVSFKPGLVPVALTEFGINDRPTKYPLPLEASQLSGETALNELNQRIINKAVAKVQDSMTPAEKEALNKDAAKYAEEMRQYEKEERAAMMQHYFRGPNDWPKAPEKPKSLVKYEAAIDREIERMARNATA
jgi:hypothetical protein